MSRFIFKRLIQMIPVLIGVTLVVFVILSLTPGDPAKIILGQKATDAQVEQLREELNLNDPILIQYFKYMAGAVRGDFGRSFSADVEVISLVRTRLPNTMSLGLLSMLCVIVVAIPLGVVIAVNQNTLFDDVMRVVTLVVSGMPIFWLGLMLIILMSVKLKLLPASGLDSPASYILPVICMSSIGIAIDTRITRASMLDVIRQDYIRTARAKGLKESYILRRHALRNALLPIVTGIGMALPGIFAGSVIVETVFGINGIGKLLVDHLRQKDIPTVMTCIFFLTIVIAVSNLLTDITYAFIDPRIKSQYVKRKSQNKAKQQETLGEVQ